MQRCQRCLDLRRVGGQGDLTQEAVCGTDVKLHPATLGDFQVLFEGLPRLVVLTGQPIAFGEK